MLTQNDDRHFSTSTGPDAEPNTDACRAAVVVQFTVSHDAPTIWTDHVTNPDTVSLILLS